MTVTPAIHPGRLLEPLILARAGISQSRLARYLGFNQPQPVNELIKGKRGITPKMALLLERLTDGDYPAEFWLIAQLRWDLNQARETIPPARLAMVHSPECLGEATAAASREGVARLLRGARQLQE